MKILFKQIVSSYSAFRGLILDKNRKSSITIINELRKINRGKFSLNYKNYFKSLMYKIDAGCLTNYFDGEMMYKIKLSLEKKGKHFILENKIEFADFMTENCMPVATYLGCIKSGTLFGKNNEKINVDQKDEFISFINQLLKINRIIFIKQTDSYGGKGIYKFQNGHKIDISKINLTRDYVIEKGLIQHSDLNEINSNCINSLRVVSMKVNENVFIPSSFLRMGVGTSYLDNASAGGVFVNYDLCKNKLSDNAYAYAQSGGRSYNKHPDSKFCFKDKKLPFPEEIQLLVRRAAYLFPDVNLIGWDIAYTNDGPVILEGNSNLDFETSQISLRGLYKNKFYTNYFATLEDRTIN